MTKLWYGKLKNCCISEWCKIVNFVHLDFNYSCLYSYLMIAGCLFDIGLPTVLSCVTWSHLAFYSPYTCPQNKKQKTLFRWHCQSVRHCWFWPLSSISLFEQAFLTFFSSAWDSCMIVSGYTIGWHGVQDRVKGYD